VYDEETGLLSIEFSGEVHESYIMKYGFVQNFKVGVLFTHEHVFPNGTYGLIETSYNHGETWTILQRFINDSIEETNIYMALTSNSLWIRYIIESNKGSGFWRLWDIDIIGDTRGTSPELELVASGNGDPENPCWVSPVSFKVEATDINGVKEIHCIDTIQRKGYSCSCDELKFVVSENGDHSLVFWAKDTIGNEGTPKEIIPTFCVDYGGPPQVKIIEPESGFYLFGKKIINMDKTIIIGPFTINATASDDNGLYRLQFILDGEIIGELTDPPYRFYCGRRHQGYGILSVTAWDMSGNMAEDKIDVHYYNFF